MCSFRKHWHSISLTQVITAGTQLTHNSPGGNTKSQSCSHTNQNLRIEIWMSHGSVHLFWNNGSTKTWGRINVISFFMSKLFFNSFMLVNTWIIFYCIISSLSVAYFYSTFTFSLNFSLFYYSTSNLYMCCVFILSCKEVVLG